MSSNAVCKEMSQEDFLKMIEDNPIFQEQLEEIGVLEFDKKLGVRVFYHDLLTEEEAKILNDRIKELSKEDYDYIKENDYIPKFAGEPHFDLYCWREAICENCYKYLLDHRKRSQH